MSRAIGYCSAVLLPILYTETPNIIHRWRLAHRGTLAPSALVATQRRDARVVQFGAVIILAMSVWWLISYSEVSLIAIGMSSAEWKQGLLKGTVAGLAWLSLNACLLVGSRPRRERLAHHLILQQPVGYLIPLGLAAAATEEMWRGFCLVALAAESHAVALAVTAIAAGWAHLQPTARALSAGVYALYAGGLFLWTRSLWTTVSCHVVVNLGTLLLIRFAFRHAVSRTSGM
jgi:membrane protease YdiL (CAAX protease family)